MGSEILTCLSMMVIYYSKDQTLNNKESDHSSRVLLLGRDDGQRAKG